MEHSTMKRKEQGTSNAEYKGRVYLEGKAEENLFLNVYILQRNKRLDKPENEGKEICPAQGQNQVRKFHNFFPKKKQKKENIIPSALSHLFTKKKK
jgi:hypothetical protein